MTSKGRLFDEQVEVDGSSREDEVELSVELVELALSKIFEGLMLFVTKNPFKPAQCTYNILKSNIRSTIISGKPMGLYRLLK